MHLARERNRLAVADDLERTENTELQHVRVVTPSRTGYPHCRPRWRRISDARDSAAMRAGHYAGVTSQGEPVSFDVTDGNEVTNVIAALAGTTISISQRFPLDDDDRWDGAARGRGVCAQAREASRC